ncbi:hypothetical protein FB451DRAFT_182425 [Mycena latifolia]|nr:hypothetical protein FB451DRAFT_182425 [Mycena latifolia]
MPLHASVTDSVLAYLKTAVTVLNDLHDAFGSSFVPTISSAVLSLVVGVQAAKKNKQECLQLVEHIPGLLYAIVDLHITSQTPGTLPPELLHHVGNFTETLHNIHTYVEAQQDGTRFKHLFRRSEMTTLLKDCHRGLQEAHEVFKIEACLTVFNSISDLQNRTESLHNELLELISELSDGTLSDTTSSVYRGSIKSSQSFSMLPAKPQVFHGREAELKHLMKLVEQSPARIAILGAGGMGKSSLAKTALHHPDVVARYNQCFFVAVESATNSIELAALIGSNIGLKPGKDLTKPVVQYFKQSTCVLLILDNMETPWEPMNSRRAVEEFLSLLTDIPHLTLIITMRGTERPAQVRWTRPFLVPLKPLTEDAAHQTFLDIADDVHDSHDIARLLRLTDYMPLAVNLMAHLVDYEGCPNVLARWETEKTSLISHGWDKQSSLDVSIAISLSNPRMTSCPSAQELLRLLSILPDGISDLELIQSDLQIQDVLRSKSTLLGTSLAYMDGKQRLKALVPIREYMQSVHPPTIILVRPLFRHFHSILALYSKYQGVERATTVSQLTLNLGNIYQVLYHGLNIDNPDIQNSILCTILFNSFRRLTGHSRTTLMDRVATISVGHWDHRVHADFITEQFLSMYHSPISSPELLISQAMGHFRNFNDPTLECEFSEFVLADHFLHNPMMIAKFYRAAGSYYCYYKKDMSMGMSFMAKALALSKSSESPAEESSVLNQIALIQWRSGDYHGGQRHALQAERLAKLAPSLYQESQALRTQALCYIGLGNYKHALSLLLRSKEIIGMCGMAGSGQEHVIMFSEAEIHLLKSEYTEARKIHRTILHSTSAEQDAHKHAFALINIAEIGVIIGEAPDVVQQSLDRAKTILQKVEDRIGITHCDKILADCMLAQGDLRSARALFEQCLLLSWGKTGDVTTYCLERLANVSRWTAADFDWTSTWTVVFIGHAKRSDGKLALHKALLFLGDVFLATGEKRTAESLFTVALEGFTHMDIHRSRGDCMLRLGDIAREKGDLVKATKLWREAQSLFIRALQAKDISQTDLRLAAVDKGVEL